MSRINIVLTAVTPNEWIQKNQKQIESHPAWYDLISEDESEALLKNKNPFTYLLRAGEKQYSYFISFVRENGAIKHQPFILELNKRGWYYRNGSTLNSPDSCCCVFA